MYEILDDLRYDKEFCVEVRNEYGEPWEWDLEDACLNDKAECYWVYKNSEDVKKAYRIQSKLGFHPERKVRAGERPHNTYNGRYTGLPMWNEFDDVRAMTLNIKEYLELWTNWKISQFRGEEG